MNNNEHNNNNNTKRNNNNNNLKLAPRRWIARARAKLMNQGKCVKGMGFRGKRSMDMFEVHACSMNYVSVSQVTSAV